MVVGIIDTFDSVSLRRLCPGALDPYPGKPQRWTYDPQVRKLTFKDWEPSPLQLAAVKLALLRLRADYTVNPQT